MKRTFLIFSALLAIVLSSCKQDAEKKDAKVQKVRTPDVFSVTAEMVIPQDVDLIIYYKDGSNEWFVEDKAVWQTVKGKPGQVQTVTFNLPEDVLPNDIRFDIGRNEYKGLKDVEIKKFTVAFAGNKFEIPESQMTFFFRPNQYITYDTVSKLYSFHKDAKGNYDPYFESKGEFYPQLAKVTGA